MITGTTLALLCVKESHGPLDREESIACTQLQIGWQNDTSTPLKVRLYLRFLRVIELDVTLNRELFSKKILDKVHTAKRFQKQSAALDHIIGVTEEK